jgi:hypothetical protein
VRLSARRGAVCRSGRAELSVDRSVRVDATERAMDHGGFDGLVVETGQCGKCFFRRLRSAERNGVASLELPTSVLGRVFAAVRACLSLPPPACPLQPAWEMWHKERTGHLPGLVSNKAKPTGKPGRHSETSDFQRCFQNSRTCTHQRPDSPLWWVMRARYHSQHGHWAGSQPRLPHGTTRHHFRVRTYRTTASLFTSPGYGIDANCVLPV